MVMANIIYLLALFTDGAFVHAVLCSPWAYILAFLQFFHVERNPAASNPPPDAFAALLPGGLWSLGAIALVGFVIYQTTADRDLKKLRLTVVSARFSPSFPLFKNHRGLMAGLALCLAEISLAAWLSWTMRGTPIAGWQAVAFGIFGFVGYLQLSSALMDLRLFARARSSWRAQHAAEALAIEEARILQRAAKTPAPGVRASRARRI
jgi:hypothetical protein